MKLSSIHANPFVREEYINLLNIGLKFSSTKVLQKPACKSLIHRILVDVPNQDQSPSQKLITLFTNSQILAGDYFDHNDPKNSIADSWLKGFCINHISMWTRVDSTTYQTLCNTHQNNRWTLYIWSRIMHISLQNLSNNNSTELLSILNDWMKDIGHETYDQNDILTIIFVNKLFDLFLSRHTRSILSLPLIDAIMNFVIGISNEPTTEEVPESINAFLANGRQILEEVLQLQSMFISHLIFFHYVS